MAILQNDSIGPSGSFGGFFGGGGGIQPVVDIGNIFGGRRHGDGDCGDRRDILAFDLTNKNIDSVRETVNRDAIMDTVRDGIDNLREKYEHSETRRHDRDLVLSEAICHIKGEIKDTKSELISCCKDGTQKIVDMYKDDRIRQLETENSNFKQNQYWNDRFACIERQNDKLVTIVNGIGNLVGNNTNTGVQV